MLWATKLFSLNPYTIAGAALGAVLVVSSTYFYGVSVGSTSAKLACEKRVAVILKDIADKNAEIERINKDWQARIDALADQYNTKLADEEKQNAELETRVTEYETKLGEVSADCRIDQRDLDSVRGKP